MVTDCIVFVFAFATTLSTARMECKLLSFEADHSEELEVVFCFPGDRRESMEIGLAVFETHHERVQTEFLV